MSDLRARAAAILNGATGGQDSWSKWDREVFDVVDEAADEIASLRAHLEQSRTSKSYQKDRAVKARRAQQDLVQGIYYWRERAEIAEEQLASARKALERVCDEIEDTEEHGGGADENDCPVCEAIRAARVLLTDEKGEQ